MMTSLRRLRIAAVVLPILTFAVWGVASWHLHYEAAVEVAKLRAELVREYVLRVLEAQRNLLDEAADLVGDAPLDELEEAGRADLHLKLSGLRERLDYVASVAAVGRGGKVVAESTRYPVHLDVTGREFYAARETFDGGYHVSRIDLRPAGTDAVILARRQNPGAADPGGIVVAAARVEAFTTFFSQIADGDNSAASILREDGLLLVRHDPSFPPMMLDEDTPVRRAVAAADEGTYEARAVSDGITRIYAFEKVGDFPVYVNYGVPRAAILADWGRQMAFVGAFLAFLAVLALVLVSQVKRRLLAERARQRSDFNRRLLEEARQSAERSRLMMEEAHHRIKNSLQLVSSFISLGRKEEGDPDTVLYKVSERVRAISSVHDLLYENNMSGADVDLVRLIERVVQSPGLTPADGSVEITFASRLESATVAAAPAVSIALVVVELVINSGKHAFAGRDRGRISVGLDMTDNEILVTVADDGVGLPDVGEDSRSSGLRLIDGILRQLGGTLERRSEAGARFLLRVPRGDTASVPPASEAA